MMPLLQSRFSDLNQENTIETRCIELSTPRSPETNDPNKAKITQDRDQVQNELLSVLNNTISTFERI